MLKELLEEAVCDGCQQPTIDLHVVDGTRLCDGCAQKSAEIDRQLVGVCSEDLVSCDGCDEPVDFDARIAVVVRGCGGKVRCDRCESMVIEGGRP